MKFNLKRAVETLAKKDLKFIQPMYEAITNSLEANATEILIDIQTENLIDNDLLKTKVVGFSVTDNGVGFTEENRESFLELWSEAKLSLGCKGSGRFTWLNVFENIFIESEVSSENTLVKIPFHIRYNDEMDTITGQAYTTSKTVITFSKVTDRYYNPNQNIDYRIFAEIDSITENITQNLLIKLFLLKRDGKRFSIKIKINEEEREITESTIPDLDSKEFNITSEINQQSYAFVLYYHFIENRKNSKKIYYCAHDRIVKTEDDDALNFSCELPDKISFNMLLCSEYLNEMVNDSRDDFPSMSNKRQASYGCPLLYRDIKPELLKQMHLILLEKFPQLETLNKEEEQKAINAAPYLAKYIRDNTDIVKTQKSLTTKALDTFNKRKVAVQDKFERALKDRSILPEAFNAAVTELSEVAAAELGEYILYRENIIKALGEADLDDDKKEKFIHDIFMPQRTVIDNTDGTADYSLTNLWLLDDKFMTYSNAFSDVTIKTIIESIFKDSTVTPDELGMDSKKPDLAVFYNKDISRDALVVEFKGCHATLGEKEKSIGEINRNCYLLKEKIKDINNVWAYIITTIDDEFEVSLRANAYKPRFTNAEDGKIFYFYNEGIAHVYALDIKAITADAFARNKTFLDILKK